MGVSRAVFVLVSITDQSLELIIHGIVELLGMGTRACVAVYSAMNIPGHGIRASIGVGRSRCRECMARVNVKEDINNWSRVSRVNLSSETIQVTYRGRGGRRRCRGPRRRKRAPFPSHGEVPSALQLLP